MLHPPPPPASLFSPPSFSVLQVHAARLSPELLSLLAAEGAPWGHGPDVVIKVQHAGEGS